jgi:hypothetical protein
MAGRPKKEETVAKVEVAEVKIEKNVSVAVDAEKEALKEQNKKMEEMMAQMQEQMKMMQMSMPQSMPNIVLEQNKDITRTVRVTSLVPNILTLSTMKNGNKAGKTYRFDKYGDTQNILFTDMQSILIYHRKQFENGLVILSTEKDYEDLGLGYINSSAKLKEKVDEIVLLKDDESLGAIFEMNEEMQEKIVDLIAHNLVKGVSYDYNKIKQLKEEGYDVEATADEMKNVPKTEKEED